jgi:type IV pilus assembly protein PilV
MRRLIRVQLSPDTRRRDERGFSLVEALLSLVIVSVGLLGVGELVLYALRESAAALTRTQATNLITDMMESIRANPEGEDAYHCAAYASGPSERGCTPSGAPALECTARELAEDDLARWDGLVRQSLPFVAPGKCEANVTYLAASADGDALPRYRVEVRWRESGGAGPQRLASELVLAGRASS